MVSSVQLRPPSVDRNAPLWCCAQITSGAAAHCERRWTSCITGSNFSCPHGAPVEIGNGVPEAGTYTSPPAGSDTPVEPEVE